MSRTPTRLRCELLESRLLLTADFNGDGRVDAADYTVWRDNLGSTGGPTTAPFAPGDANGDGSVDRADYHAWRSDFGDASLPDIFSILEPSGFITTPTPTVRWQAAPFAATYDIAIATDSGCLNPIQSFESVVGESLMPAPLSEGEYHVCVTARNEGGSREASNNGLSFTYDVTPPGSFDITLPSGGGTFVTTPTVEWNQAFDATEYTVVVSASADLSDPLQTTVVTSTSLALDPLGSGTYFLSVTAHDAAGNERPADNSGVGFTIEGASGPLVAFVTSELYVNNGDTSVFPPGNPFFASVEAADFYVTAAAANAGLIADWDGITLLYQAVLSDDDLDARDRLPIGDRPIVNVLGQTIAESGAALFSGNLQNPININEFGQEVTSSLTAWTGSSSNGTSDETCGSWLNPSLTGSVGDVTATDTQWILTGVQTCFSQARFYAIGPFEPEAPATAAASLASGAEGAADLVTAPEAVRIELAEESSPALLPTIDSRSLFFDPASGGPDPTTGVSGPPLPLPETTGRREALLLFAAPVFERARDEAFAEIDGAGEDPEDSEEEQPAVSTAFALFTTVGAAS